MKSATYTNKQQWPKNGSLGDTLHKLFVSRNPCSHSFEAEIKKEVSG
jgi:hypothetical protein